MVAKWTQWTAVHARELVDDLEASGLSMAQFCRERGVSADRLQKWRSRFRREVARSAQRAGAPPTAHEEPRSDPRLVELVARPVDSRTGVCLRVRCPSGHVVEALDVDLLVGFRAALTAVWEVSRC